MVRPKFYTPNEVAVHNTMEDLWVSFLGKVYDLTPLCEKYKGDVLLKPILQAGGTDISHWFNPKTKDIRTHICPETKCVIPYCQLGRFIHIPPACPASDWINDFGSGVCSYHLHGSGELVSGDHLHGLGELVCSDHLPGLVKKRPWWKDDSYSIGVLSEKTRSIKIINTLTSQDQVIEVCSEENMKEILDRYIMYNTHAASYTWKYAGKNLDMDKTLQENGIEDEDEQFYELGMNDDQYLQAIHLYFNDDLTEA